MAESEHILTNRFAAELTDAQIDAKVLVAPEPLIGLSDLPADVAAHRIELAAKSIFVPSQQTRQILRGLQGLARTYAELRYPNTKTFLQHAYASEAEHARFEPKLGISCLLGLPGVGKSAVVAAFERLFPPISLEIPNHGAFVTQAAWRMTVKAGSGLATLATPLFRQPESLKRQKSLFATIQRELCEQGVTLLIADELQFLSQGQGNILPAKLLNQLGRLGPPLLFVANFILIHRLNKRPAEEKQRLLTKPHFLHPDAQGSTDWRAFIDAVLKIAPEFSQLCSDASQKLLHTYTFGLRRLAVLLLTQAYLLMRKRKANHVGIDDIEMAYLSYGYATSRNDVEILIAGLAKKERREDLWCPLPGADPPAMSCDNISPHPATDEYVRRRDNAALNATLTQVEREALQLTTGGNPKPKPERRPPRPKPTTASLLDGAARFREKQGAHKKP